MYHVIALKDTGEMVMFANYNTKEPNIEMLQAETEGFRYTQLLVVGPNDIGDGMQLARYALESPPAILKTVLLR